VLSLIFSGKESEVVIPHYFSIFSRLLLHNPPYFLELLQIITNTYHTQLVVFVDHWISHIDSYAEFKKRKTSFLSIISLLNYSGITPEFIEKMVETINYAVGAIDDEEGGEGPERKVSPTEKDKDYENLYCDSAKLNEKEKGSFILATNDPVNKITIRQYLIQEMKKLENMNQPIFNLLINNLDKDTLSTLMK